MKLFSIADHFNFSEYHIVVYELRLISRVSNKLVVILFYKKEVKCNWKQQ